MRSQRLHPSFLWSQESILWSGVLLAEQWKALILPVNLCSDLFSISNISPPVELQSFDHHLSQVVLSVFCPPCSSPFNPYLSNSTARILWGTWLKALHLSLCLPDPEIILVGHDLPLIRPCWWFPVTILAFMRSGLPSRGIHSVTFPGTQVGLPSL